MAAHKEALTPSVEIESITEREAGIISPCGAALWGTNSKCRAICARALLGWSPKAKGLDHYIAEADSAEARRMRLVLGHIITVAG